MPPRRTQFIKHTFGGGWATEFGPSVAVPIQQNNHAVIPYLTTAENVMFKLDGGPRKIPGSTKNHAAALESGADITGIFDAWFSGTAGTPTQRRIIHVSTKIKQDGGNDTYADLFTGLTAGAIPAYCMFEDLLIMSNTTEVPKSWDLTTAQNLAGSPPSFAFAVAHKNKVFASGAVAAPSRLYYCVDLTPADWTNSGSGSIDIDPDDGDVITGLASFNNDLWVFKGPNKGSIHRITGSAPTGGDAYARTVFKRGVACGAHNSIVHFANDLAFMTSSGVITTLSAVDKFGDFDMASATSPINDWLRDHVTKSSIRKVQASNWDDQGVLIYAIPINSSSVCNFLLMLDYRFSPARLAAWTVMNFVISLCPAIAYSTKAHSILLGGTDGFVRTLGSSTRTIDSSTAIPFNVATPYIDYDVPERMKTYAGGSVTVVPQTNGTLTMGWTRDGQTAQSEIIDLDGAGALLGSFMLGVDVLGSARYLKKFFDADQGGEFRDISYSFANSVAGMDIELHQFGARLVPSAESNEN